MSPQSFDEFVDLVDQAIFEIDEILLCVDDEGDEHWEFCPTCCRCTSGCRCS